MKCCKCNGEMVRNNGFCPHCGNKPQRGSFSKKTIVVLLILFIFTIISFVVSLLAVVIPKKIEGISPEKFISIMEQQGCKVINTVANMDSDSFVYHYVTMQDGCPFAVTYAKFLDEEYQDNYFYELVDDVYDNGKIRRQTTIDINLGAHYVQYATHGNYSKAVILNNTTILYVKTSNDKNANANKLVQQLGYHYVPNFEKAYLFLLPILFFVILIGITIWNGFVYFQNKKVN